MGMPCACPAGICNHEADVTCRDDFLRTFADSIAAKYREPSCEASPRDLYDQMRRDGTCVTSPAFQGSCVATAVVPVMTEAHAPLSATTAIPSPKDDSMPDG